MRYLLSAALLSFILVAAIAWTGAARLSPAMTIHMRVNDYFEKTDSLNIRLIRSVILRGTDTVPAGVQIETIESAGMEYPGVSLVYETCRIHEKRGIYGEPETKGGNNNIIVSVFNHRTGEVYYMDLEEYLVGVVFSEMPASFELEALKAQAVAARSYAVYKIMHARAHEPQHYGGAYVCTDFRHCKAHISFEAAAELHGGGNSGGNHNERFGYLWQRVRSAVEATAGEIITYNSEPAIAVFHAMSGSMTEAAENVWGTPVPYLAPVPTKESEQRALIRNYETTARFTAEEFRSVLINGGFTAELPRNPRRWLEGVEINSSGRIAHAAIYGQAVSGVRLRELFGLRSTDFTIELTESGDFIFTVRGHGHGVGMSQYGANLMAMAGRNYSEILKWYYTGIKIASAGMFLTG